MNTIKYIPEATFLVPDGIYRAQIIDVRECEKFASGARKKLLRVIFGIMDETDSYIQYKAGKSYEPKLTQGSQLRNDLECMGALCAKRYGDFNPESLNGMEADIVIRQKHNPGYALPFCEVIQVCAAGTLTEPLAA